MNIKEHGQQGDESGVSQPIFARKAEPNPGACDRAPGSPPLMPRHEVETLMARQAYWQSAPGVCRCGSGLDTYLCTTCWPQ